MRDLEVTMRNQKAQRPFP